MTEEKEKRCPVCGRTFANGEYCSIECAEIVSRLHLEQRRNNRRLRAKRDAALNASIEKLRREQCINCVWRCREGGASFCNYLYATGARRERDVKGRCLSWKTVTEKPVTVRGAHGERVRKENDG